MKTNNRATANIKDKTITFTCRHNGKIQMRTLAEGQETKFESYGQTEEGYSSSETVYEFSNSVLTRYHSTESKDCDGRYSSESTSVALLKPDVDGDGYDIDWVNQDSTQRDHTAEAAGY